LLELVYFFHHLISSLELKQSNDLEFHLYFDAKQSSSEKEKQRKQQFHFMKRQQQQSESEAVIGASLDDTMMITEDEEEEEEETKENAKKEEERESERKKKKNHSKFPEGWTSPLYTKGQLEQFQLLFSLLEQSTESKWLFLSSQATSVTLRNALKMNLLSLLTSSYFLSSYSVLNSSNGGAGRDNEESEENVKATQGVGQRKARKEELKQTGGGEGDLSNLTFSTFLTMKGGDYHYHHQQSMKSTAVPLSDYQQEDPPQWILENNNMNYTISDLLDGSIFLY
jgi:hypothetical protein